MYFINDGFITSTDTYNLTNVTDILNVLNNSSNKVRKGNRKYEFTISKSELESLLIGKGTALCDHYTCTADMISDIKVIVKLNIFNYVEKIEFNINDVNLIYDFSNYNKVSVKIPEVTENIENDNNISISQGDIVTE